MILKRLFPLLIIVGLTLPTYCQTCPPGSPSSIYFANGVLNTHQDAMNSAYHLQQAVLSQTPTSNPLNPTCINFKLAWDQEFLDSNNNVINIANFIAQLAVAGYQLNQQFLSQLWLSWSSFLALPTFVQQTIDNQIINPTLVVTQSDLQLQLADYHDDVSAGNKIVTVAHSQGNLYTNQAWRALGSPLNTSFSVVAVATPADFVPNQDPWVTLNDDIILNVPRALGANINNNPIAGAPCSSTAFLGVGGQLACHSFIDSYLAGTSSRSEILQDVIAALPVYLGVSKLGPGTGGITSVPSGVDCASSCTSAQAAFTDQTSVTLTAQSDTGSTFLSWSGDCASLATGGITNANSISFPVFYDVSGTVITSFPENCTATFGPASVLMITKSGTGTGTVSSVPAGINCGPACSTQNAPFPATPPVQLTATFAAGSIFTGWSADCASAGTNPAAQVTVNANKTCDAKFDLGGILTVTKSGSGTGTVSSVPAGINCGPACTIPQMAPFPSAPPVQLIAAAASGSTFMGWSGDCTGMALTTTISVTANMTCTATFGGQLPAVRLNPFGNQSAAPPYNIEVVNNQLTVIPAPGDITVTLLREVISQCSGLLFSSNRTVVILQGQSSAAYNFNAGRDPACNTLPITTRYTITGANLSPNQVLDLSGIPNQQLVLAVTR